MPGHIHVVVYPGDTPELISGFLQAVKEPVARQAIRYLKSNAPEWLARLTVREGPRLRHRFWQPGGGYDRNLTSIEALRAVPRVKKRRVHGTQLPAGRDIPDNDMPDAIAGGEMRAVG